jgi:predicted lipoprotein with Yx(FWY)xxD motif
VKRIATILLSTMTVLALAGVASATSPPAQLKVHKTGIGKILVDRAGFTVYEFTRDHGKHNSCVQISHCPAAWPALTTTGKPLAGTGVNRTLLGTITLSGGVKQVTYAGHPLYTYVGDSGPGQTSYVGVSAFGGSWYALNTSGHAVK